MPLLLGPNSRDSTVVDGALGRQGAHVVEMQRRRLLFAVGEIVGEEGLEGASVGRICRRASVSRRTFYDLFADSEACLLEAFERTIASIAEGVAPAYEAETKWYARIRAGLIVLLELFDLSPVMARLCLVETVRAGADVVRRRKQIIDLVVAAIDEGRSESTQGAALSHVVAQGVTGGCLSVVGERLLETDHPPLVELLNPLMGMIVQPYLGAAAAKRELEHSAPASRGIDEGRAKDPFSGLEIRFTYRTARVLATIEAHSGASNRLIAEVSGVADVGQMSRLLARLQRSGLIENRRDDQSKGEPNVWTLTARGSAVHAALGLEA